MSASTNAVPRRDNSVGLKFKIGPSVYGCNFGRTSGALFVKSAILARLLVVAGELRPLPLNNGIVELIFLW